MQHDSSQMSMHDVLATHPCCHERQYFILSYDSVVRPSLCVVLVTYFVCATSTLSSHAKWNKSDRKKSRPCDFTHLWDIKLKATNQQTRKTNKFKDTDNSMVVTRKKGGGVLKGEGTQIYGDRRGFDLGWWAHNTIYILLPCVTPINLIKKKKKESNLVLSKMALYQNYVCKEHSTVLGTWEILNKDQFPVMVKQLDDSPFIIIGNFKELMLVFEKTGSTVHFKIVLKTQFCHELIFL